MIRDLPRPEVGEFVLLTDEPTKPRLALRWTDSRGEEAIIRITDGYLAHGVRPLPPWLPEGWVMDTYPIGRELPHLACWFQLALSWVHTERLPGIPVESLNRNPPCLPTPRELVRHAHLLVRELALRSSPSEPRGLMDPAGCEADLRDTLGFLRRVLASPSPPPANRRPCYDRDHTWLRWKDDEKMGDAAIRDRWNRENPAAKIPKGEGGRDVVKKGLTAARRDKE
jgi:hypothetical protein